MNIQYTIYKETKLYKKLITTGFKRIICNLCLLTIILEQSAMAEIDSCFEFDSFFHPDSKLTLFVCLLQLYILLTEKSAMYQKANFLNFFLLLQFYPLPTF